jgi:hypothetical protein
MGGLRRESSPGARNPGVAAKAAAPDAVAIAPQPAYAQLCREDLARRGFKYVRIVKK